MYTASSALLDAFNEAGVEFIFANYGSDHPALLEAIAERQANGGPVPRVITCPNEMVGLSAAHGHALVSGQAQAVVVHVECGTQALAGAIHNADKGRAPVLIFAGASPFTQLGELKGSRNEFIHWIQDVHDQRGIVRGYMRYDNEVRTGRNIGQLVHRAMRFAHSHPQGPVYLVGAREVMEEEVPPPSQVRCAGPLGGAGLAPEAARQIAAALASAKRPLVVTSYLGRRKQAVDALVKLCSGFGVGVLESVPNCLNYPHDEAMYLGNYWNEPVQQPALSAADVIIVIDCDVPWIPLFNEPSANAQIFHIDVDPLKAQMPLWDAPLTAAYAADATICLGQILDALRLDPPSAAVVEERRAHYATLHQSRAARLQRREAASSEDITIEGFLADLRERLAPNTIILSEAITNYQPVFDHLRPARPGSIFTSGGGSLGWNGGAAIGAKLADPASEVIAITGDGSYMFSSPSSVHWMARRYQTPFLQIVLNNGGWKAPRLSTLAVHPEGYASKSDDLGVGFDPAPDYGAIAAAAGGAWTRRIRRSDEISSALDQALATVRHEGRAAVLEVMLPG